MSYLVLPPSVEKVQEVRIQLQVDRLGNSWDWGLGTHLRMRRMMGSQGEPRKRDLLVWLRR